MFRNVFMARTPLVLAIVFVVLAMFGARPASAAGVVGNGTPASCTEAAFDTALVGGGAITFNCGPNPKTIKLSAPKSITVSTTINGGNLITLKAMSLYHFQVFSGQVFVLKNIALVGSSGSDGSIENFGTTRAINVKFRNNKTTGEGGAIRNYGLLVIKKSLLNKNQAANAGGAIYNDGGTTRIKASTFQDNKVTGSPGHGGAIANHAGDVVITASVLQRNVAANGGALYTYAPSTNTVKTSTFDSNNAVSNGGGMENFGGMQINKSTLSNNTAGNVGGGISHGGNLSLYDSTISGNRAGAGGGMRDFGNSTYISGSTFSGNTATADGGGVSSSSSAYVVNSTISGNQAGLLANGGGGWHQRYGHSTLVFVTIANNKASFGAGVNADGSVTTQVDFQNTVLSKNAGGNCAGSMLVSLGNNLSSDNYCGSFTNTGDMKKKNAKLGALANNGGPTMTHLPQAGSLLINNGATVGGITKDQRGVTRPQGAKPDIGAVEVQ